MPRGQSRTPGVRLGSERRSGRHSVMDSPTSPSASSSAGEEPDDHEWPERTPRTPGPRGAVGGAPKPSTTTWHCQLDGCTKFFMREADLKRHQRTSKQHNSKSYHCVCGRAFTRLDATRRHCVSFGHDFPAALRISAGEGDDDMSVGDEQQSGLALLVAAAATLTSGPAKTSVPTGASDTEEDDDDTYAEDLGSSSTSSALETLATSQSSLLSTSLGLDQKLADDRRASRKDSSASESALQQPHAPWYDTADAPALNGRQHLPLEPYRYAEYDQGRAREVLARSRTHDALTFPMPSSYKNERHYAHGSARDRRSSSPSFRTFPSMDRSSSADRWNALRADRNLVLPREHASVQY